MQQPGWYPSPQYPGQLQYWDGYQWTPQVKPPAGSPEQTVADPNYVFPQLPARPATNFHIKSKTALRIVAAILFFIALIPLTLTAPTIASNLAGGKVETVGKVVNIDYSTSRSKGSGRSMHTTRTCAPIAEYTVDGKKYTAKSNVYTAPCNTHIGDAVKVKYDEKNPANGNVKESGGIMAVAWFFFIGGLALLGGGIVALVKSFKVKEQ